MAAGDCAKNNLSSDLKLGERVIEGKTKVVYKLTDKLAEVVLYSKDRITCGDGARANVMEGKAAISTATTSTIFSILNKAGVKTHFLRQHSDREFIAHHCDMVPIEWVTRRVATGSFLKRHPGVKEGYRFCPPKQETFFKDDANHDPQWSYEQLVDAKLQVGGKTIGPCEIAVMDKMTLCVFEILEHLWNGLNCSLVDMKLEFGISRKTGEILLADIVDSDSWRLWPAGDKRLMVDKQVYRNLKEVTQEGLDTVKRNFQWVADKVKELAPKPTGQAVVIMGSPTDKEHCQKICNKLASLNVPCAMRVSSAHKGTQATMRILAEYEGGTRPTVFIAVAGRSNGLGPVLSGNATWPVINAPPVTPDWAEQDVWSSLRLPSGLGCSTVLSPDAAALSAAQMLALQDGVIWSRLRAEQMNTWVKLCLADRDMSDIMAGQVTVNGH